MSDLANQAIRQRWTGYLASHRLGAAPLWFSVLVILIGGRLLSILVLKLVPLDTPGPVVLAAILCDTVIIGWQIAGVMRAARRYYLERGAMLPAWAAYAMIPLAVFLYVTGTFDLLSSGLNTRDYIAEQAPSLPLENGLVQIGGDIDLDQFNALKSLLETSQIEGLQLNSYGGGMIAAREIARLVQEHGLSTHVDAICASACTMIFVASDQRSLAPTGHLGFHGYRQLDQIKTLEIDAEESKDLTYLINRGISPDFAAKAYALPPAQMWFPDRQTLIEAGVIPRD